MRAFLIFSSSPLWLERLIQSIDETSHKGTQPVVMTLFIDILHHLIWLNNTVRIDAPVWCDKKPIRMRYYASQPNSRVKLVY